MDRPLTLNRYAYALNNPINYVDPTGWSAIAVPLILVGGAALTSLLLAALATAMLVTKTLRTWGILFSVPRGVARHIGKVKEDYGQPGGGQQWVFDGGVTWAQGFRPIVAFALLPF